MIGDILTITPTDARDIASGSIVLLWDDVRSSTVLVKCKGHTDTWSVFAFENGATFRVFGSHSLRVVTGVEDWDTMSDDTRMDLELDLMIRGA